MIILKFWGKKMRNACAQTCWYDMLQLSSRRTFERSLWGVSGEPPPKSTSSSAPLRVRRTLQLCDATVRYRPEVAAPALSPVAIDREKDDCITGSHGPAPVASQSQHTAPSFYASLSLPLSRQAPHVQPHPHRVEKGSAASHTTSTVASRASLSVQCSSQQQRLGSQPARSRE